MSNHIDSFTHRGIEVEICYDEQPEDEGVSRIDYPEGTDFIYAEFKTCMSRTAAT